MAGHFCIGFSLNLYPNLLLLVNRLSAVADVGDGADDEESGEAMESEDFAGDEDGCPECVACACEYGGEAEGCGERERDSEHSCDKDSECGADGEKRGDYTSDESGGECENRDGELYNPIIPVNPGGSTYHIFGGSTHYICSISGDVPNYISIPGNTKAHVQQVCSKSGVAALEKYEQ